jgi:hypothetical protein
MSENQTELVQMLSLTISAQGERATAEVKFDEENPYMPQIFQAAYCTLHQNVLGMLIKSGCSPQDAIKAISEMIMVSLNTVIQNGSEESSEGGCCEGGCDCGCEASQEDFQ